MFGVIFLVLQICAFVHFLRVHALYLVEQTWVRGDQSGSFGLVEEQNQHKYPLENQPVHGLVKLGSIGKNPVWLKFRLDLFVVKNGLQ